MLNYNAQDFMTLISNITGCRFCHFREDESVLEEYERTQCLIPQLQPMMRKEELLSVCSSLDNRTFYRILDSFGIGILIFSFMDDKWISSPFIRKEWNRDNMERILASAAMKASMLPSLELYYTSLPLLSSTRMMKLIMAIINSYSPMEEEYDFVPLEEGMALEKRKNQSLDLNADYSFIYRRYDMENRFLRVVKEGNIDELDTSIKDMVDFSQNSDSTLFTGLYRKNISSGMSVLRTLARKAAEDAGVSVITIDIITQRAVQKIDSEMRQSEIIRITKEMIRELTEEVRKENILLKGISPTISRCINHIKLHYAENITLGDLCSISSMSKANLTRRFQKETGTTVFTYIRNARCHHAVALLEEGVLTIKEIAGYVGYPDYNYFSKVFRSYAGVSPVEYRKEHLNRNGR